MGLLGWIGLGGGNGSTKQSDRMSGNIGDGFPQPVCLPLQLAVLLLVGARVPTCRAHPATGTIVRG